MVESKSKNIIYIGYFTARNNPNNFLEFPSCNNKMLYIIDSLKTIGYYVTVYSLGESNKLHSSKEIKVDDLEKNIFVSTVYKSNIFLKVISRTWLILQILYFILFKIDKNSKIIVYHTYFLLGIIRFSRFFKKFELIYEVEEIYKAAWNAKDSDIKKEIQRLKFADKYIFVNDLINEIFDFNKKHIVCYGNYNKKQTIKKTINKNEIKIIYAGVIGDNNSDVYLSIEMMKYLPNHFFLKIVGYGSNENIENLINHIDNLGFKEANRIKYDGFLSGNKYLEYINKCDIGISTRLLPDNLSNFTFPSKVLVYLSHNLITVSSKISCVYNSKVANSIYFIDELTPKGVAETILNINFDDLKNNNIINELDENFKYKLKLFID